MAKKVAPARRSKFGIFVIVVILRSIRMFVSTIEPESIFGAIPLSFIFLSTIEGFIGFAIFVSVIMLSPIAGLANPAMLIEGVVDTTIAGSFGVQRSFVHRE